MKQNELKVTITFLSILLIILVATLGFSINKSITGEVIQEIPNSYTYTKAICNEDNFCEDYVISCKNNNLVEIESTGYATPHYSDWKDPRTQEEIDKIC